jgi:DNA-binding CsgD family transcriptional regulator
VASSEPTTARLSARQIECLTRIAAGETSAEIALALGVSRRTVDEYVGAACARLGVRSRSQAVAVCISQNIIPRSLAP